MNTFPDLSQHKAQCFFIRIPEDGSTANKLAIALAQGLSFDDYARADLGRVGFLFREPDYNKCLVPCGGDPTSGPVVPEEVEIALRQVFARMETTEYDPEIHYRDLTNMTRTVDLAPHRVVGYNVYGKPVHDVDGVRVVAQSPTLQTREDDRDSQQPGPIFLRATDDASLLRCAEAWVASVAAGRVDADDAGRMAAFARDVSTEGFEVDPRAMERAVARAASLRVARVRGTLNSAFTEAMGAGAVGNRSSFAVAMRRVVGTGPAVAGKTVAVRGDVDAACLVGFDRSTRLDLEGDLALDGRALARDVGPSPDSGPDHLLRTATNAAQVRAAEKELARRAAEGVAVLVVPTGFKDLAGLRDRVAMGYDFAAEAVVPRSVTGAGDVSVLLVGDRRPVADPGALPPVPEEIANTADLWSWTARATMELNPESRAKDGAVETVRGRGEANKWQVPYRSLTAVGETTKMVPRNLDGAVKRALERVGAAHPDVMGWLGDEFGYTRTELEEIFTPEQLDAMALKVHAEERGRGFLLADQTGVGKGRTQAAFMRRDVLKGRRPVYLNVSVSQLDDLMRDIVATRSEDVLKPALLNSAGYLRNPVTKETMAEATPADAPWVVEGRWPEDATLVLASYAQFNRKADEDGTPSAKAAWLESVARGGGVTLRADECQEGASQTSNTHANIVGAMAHMEDVTYASSTPFRGIGQFGFFAPLLPEGVVPANVAQMIQKGGDAFAETLSTMLVADGVMVRREFDVRDLEVELHLDKENYERNRSVMDAFAAAFGAVNRLALRNAVAARTVRSRPASVAPSLDTALEITIASLLYDLNMKIALDILRSGEGKTYVTVTNTLESFFEELAETDDPPTLRNYMGRLLDRATKARTKDGGTVDLLEVPGPEGDGVREAHAEARAAVDALPDLGFDLIDRYIRGFEAAGFPCGEITGRSLRYDGNKVVPRVRPRDKDVVDAYNAGRLDAMVINDTAATGLSIHAGAEFADQRRRHALEAQPSKDVIKRVQTLGRSMRHDQVCVPKYHQTTTGTPAQLLKGAQMNAKLRAQSASTTSNRDAAMVMRGIPDLCNPVGDATLSRMASSRPELLERMGFVAEEVGAQAQRLLAQDDKAIDSYADSISEAARHRREAKEKTADVRRVSDLKRSANEIMFRLQGLPVSEQERFCMEATAEFNATLEELEALGENPLNTTELRGTFVPTDETVFEPGLAGSDSAFHSDIRLVKGHLRRPGKGLMPDEVVELVEIGEAGARRSVECARRIREDMTDHLEEYVPSGQPDVAAALAAGSKQVVERRDRLERLAGTLDVVTPGKRIEVTVGGEPRSAIVTRIEHPPVGHEHVPGRYGVEYVVFGEEAPRTYRLDTLIRDKAASTNGEWNVSDGLTGEEAPKVKSEIEAAAKSNVTACSILVGNVYKAMELSAEMRLGRLCTVRTEEGVLERALVLSGRARSLEAMPISLSDAEVAARAVTEMGVEVFASPNLRDKSVHIAPGEVEVTLTLPPLRSRTWGLVYDSPLMRRLAEHGESHPKKRNITVHLRKAQVRDAIESLMETGVKFYTSPGNRDLVDRVRPAAPEDRALPAPAMAA